MRTFFALIASLFLAGSSFAATTYLGVECDTNGAVVFPTNFLTGNSFGAAGALTNLDTRNWTNNTGIYGNGVGLTNVPVTLPSGVLTNNYSIPATFSNNVTIQGNLTNVGAHSATTIFSTATGSKLTPSIKIGSTAFLDTSGGDGLVLAAGINQASVILRANTITTLSASTNGIVTPYTLTATNGVQLMLKPSFTTNFTCTTNLQVYLCNGTNQLVTLPNAAYVPNVIYRFAVTNGWAKVIITNATGAQTIRDGTSLSFTQIGIGAPAFFSDGAHWWPAARTKVIMPNAQFSCTTNIPLTLATTSYPVTFNSVDFDFSQGIALAAGTNGLASKMWITNSGQYEFSPSIVINFNGNNTVTTWFKKDDVNVPNSATAIKGAAGGSIRCVTIPFVVSVTNAAAFEIWVQSTGAGDQLFIQAASGAAPNDMPLSPSVICPVKKISDLWP